MMTKEIEYPSYATTTNPIAGMSSWGAIFAGVFVTIATMAALSLLGMGIGLVSAPAASSAGGLVKGLGIGAGVWLFVSGIISFYVGGWITGRRTRAGIISESVANSVVTWAVATAAFLFLLTSAVGGALSGAASLVGSGVKAAGAGGTAVASSAPQSAQRLVQQAQAQGQRLVQQAQANAPSSQAVAQAAETASKAAGATGIAGFFLLVVEVLACVAGGRFGTRVLKPRPMNAARPREPLPVS